MDYKVHELIGEFAYDETQTNEGIKSSDVLATDDGVVGFMLDAWPVAVTLNPGQFHQVKKHISKMDWTGPRMETIKNAVAEAVKRGLAVHPNFV